MLNRGDGTFEYPLSLSLARAPAADPAIGDFNGDGKTDLAFPDSAHGYACALLGKGDGTFGAALPHTTVSAPTIITASDFNEDGILDLSVGDAAPGGRIRGSCSASATARSRTGVTRSLG